MTQVTRTVNELIVSSLYLIGELRVGETADNFMLNSGLEIINATLDRLSADSIYIPFLTTINFTMVPNQSTYTVSNIVPADITADRIVDLTYVNYSFSSIVYQARVINEATYRNVVRLNNLIGRPGFVWLEKKDVQSNVVFYPAPDQPYNCEINAKVMIDKLDANEDLNELPPFYYEFLKYALGRKFKQYYPTANWTPESEKEYQDMLSMLTGASEVDLTLRPSSVLDSPMPFYWPNILAY